VIACLVGKSPRLTELAGQFSPVIEKIGEAVVFSVDGLGSLIGNVFQIAAEIARHGAQMEINANLAIAINKSTALLAARHYQGVTIIEPGREAKILAEIPIEALPGSADLLDTLLRWGIHTAGDLAALPESGVRERLGENGSKLRRLALGQCGDVIAVHRDLPEYAIKRELDDSVEQLEHLLFIVSAQLHELTERLRRDGRSAGGVVLRLALDGGQEFIRKIEFPVATRDPLAVLKQLQLSLDAMPPGAGISTVQTVLTPADPRIVQGGLFQAAAPEPDKLQTLLARLGALAGKENVGSPEILNSHRPDAFGIRPCAFEPSDPAASERFRLRIAFRHFRPSIKARVIVQRHTPIRVLSERVSGHVVQSAGPWRTSGGLWAASSWNRDEWDVLLDDRALYRIYFVPGNQWFLCGGYD
jgi:protein ImuB